MLNIEISPEKQAVIENASRLLNMNIEQFIINQVYEQSVAILSSGLPQGIDSNASNVVEHSPLIGKYKDKMVIHGDIIEPVLTEAWMENNDKWSDL